MRIWSNQQEAIFDFTVNGIGHLIVRARAGTGKTTTLVEAVLRWLAAHPGKRLVICAFNTRIAAELTTRFVGVQGVEVKTLHAMGKAIVMKWWPNVRVNDKKKDPISRADDLTNRVCGQRVPDALKKLISKLHSLGREIKPLATTAAELIDLAERFECEPSEEWLAEGWTTERLAGYAVLAMKLAAEEKPVKTGIDFADMIFLPVRNGWLHGIYDGVLVDEAQDMTEAQLMVAQGLLKADGRMIIVGDDRQAIYGFRGADSGSLDRLKRELNATELGLTVTYRCGLQIVNRAKQIVPDFEAGPNNPEGEILGLPMSKLVDEADLGDFILSRANAPLVGVAMSLLRNGKKARIAGKDIGRDLIDLTRRLVRGAGNSVPAFIERVEGWKTKQVERAAKLKNPEAKIELVLDQAEMLINIADNAPSVTEVQNRIEALFTDEGLGAAGIITLSSVHKAKGLEANRVFVLAETLKNHTDEEMNIQYVAITRAKQTLVMVGGQVAA